MFLQDAKELMKKHPELEIKFKGCSEDEIAKLEIILNEKIPEAFKEFLRWFGKSGGEIMRGSDFYYPYLSNEIFEDWKEEGIIPKDYTFKNHGIELLNKNNFDGNKILQNAILFMSHQGYAINYINSNEGENPPVYMFVEQGKWKKLGPTIWANSFSEYIVIIIKNTIDELKKIKRTND